MATKSGNNYRKIWTNQKFAGGCRRRGKCHKHLSARMCSQLWSTVALCCSCSAHGHSFYPPRTALRVLQGKLNSWMSGWAPWGNKPLTRSDLSILRQTICPRTTLNISWYHRLRSQLMCTKTGTPLQSLQGPFRWPFRSPLAYFCYKHWRELHSRADPAVQKSFAVTHRFIFQPYQSHSQVYPMATQAFALDKGCFSQQQHLLKDMLGSCLNSLDPTFLSFHCISEKQEAATHKHHTSFRAWCEAHQKAIGIFLLVLVGFSYSCIPSKVSHT